MKLLEGKVAVITGGTRGFGFAIARAFATEGASVVVASRSQKAVDEAVNQLQSQRWNANGLAVDVADLSQVESLAEHAVKGFGKLDIWVNNAGIAGAYGPTLDLAPEAFHQVIQTNITGVYYGSRVAMKHFLVQHSGKLINVLGMGYNRPAPMQNAYGSSKAWGHSFTRALAEETKGSGVGVYAFNPGMMLTDLLTNVEVISGYEERLKSFPVVVRMLAKLPELPAKKVLWTASAATDGKTGLMVSASSTWLMLGGALREGLRALFKRPAPPVKMRIKTIPPA